MPGMSFSRPTVMAAVEMFELLDSSRIDQLALRLRISDHVPTAGTKAAKCYALGTFVDDHGTRTVDTLDGSMSLAEAVVREAARIAQQDSPNQLQAAFARGLERDGYALSWNDDGGPPTLLKDLPDEVQLPETDDQVRRILKQFHFTIPLGHLDDAVGSHTAGLWGAANSQIRTFFEGLLDEIAYRLRPGEARDLPQSESRRQLLAQIGFLSRDRKEWSDDARDYVHGLFKMLHTEGSHPGLSDEDHSTFRLHVVLVTARALLRRLADWSKSDGQA